MRPAVSLARRLPAHASRVVIATIIACAWAGRARAHCTAPDIIQPLFRAPAPREIELWFSFGAAISEDDGASWALQCEEAYQDPGETLGPEAVRLLPDGTMLVAHFIYGLLNTGPVDRACHYATSTGLAGGEALHDLLVNPSAPNVVYVVLDDQIRRSIDGGRSVANGVLGSFPGENLLGHGAIAENGQTMVVPGFDSIGRFFVFSTDSGNTWQLARSPFGADELTPAGVDPSNPLRVYALHGLDTNNDMTVDAQVLVAITLAPGTLVANELYRAPATVPTGGGLLAFAQGNDANEIWIGVRGVDKQDGTASLHHSLDGGLHVTDVAGPAPHFRCLVANARGLWACGNNLTAGDPFALGVSTDGGATWAKRFSFGDLCQAVGCLSATCGNVFRQSCVPGLCDMPPPDGGDIASPDAAAVVTPPQPGGGCCRAAGRARASASSTLVALGAIALVLRRRRRR